MLNFLQQLQAGIGLLPSYLSFLIVVLVILPTIVTLLLRFTLYRYLVRLGVWVRGVLVGERYVDQPGIIHLLERRTDQASHHLEQVNTAALIEGAYSQEEFPFVGFSLRCEAVDYFSRTLPNLLLAFGLLGTFLGITINLGSLSQIITQANIRDVGTLVQQLNQPLQGMGIAFISSLIAVVCSSVLTVANLYWNTALAKSALLNSLEDYFDNIYLPTLGTHPPVGKAVDRLVNELSHFLTQFSRVTQATLQQALTKPIEQLVETNDRNSQLAEQIYRGLFQSSETIADSAKIFQQAANTIEQSKFAEKLSTATADLAIAQNQFSQSSLVLKRSTQSIEFTLETLQSSVQRMLQISEEISQLNQKYVAVLSTLER